MKSWQKNCLSNLASLSLGILLTFAFAPYGIFPLAVLTLTGLLALSLHVSPRRAFSLGFWFGIGLFGAGVYWVFISIHNIGDVPTFFAGLITAVFIMILALFPACVQYLSNRYFASLTDVKIMLAYPSIWVFSEWIRSFLATGFPWLYLGYSQTNSPLKGYAAYLGVYGISFLILLSSALLLRSIVSFRQRLPMLAWLNLIAILCLWGGGSILHQLKWTKKEGAPLSVALVQGNIPQTLKWSPEHLQLSLNRYETLTDSLWQKDRLILWPEAAIPTPLQDSADYINRLDEKARETHSHLLLGIPIQTADGQSYYNAIVTLGGQNQVYLKRFLVPFGEFIPFSNLLGSVLTFMDIPMSNMTSGRYQQKPLVIGHTKILASICYEITFPDLIRTNDKNIGLLLTITNDAWFGASNAQAQHLQMAAMRALEFERPVLFVSNDGITAIIGPDGKTLAMAPPRTPYVLTSNVQPMIGLTPWMRTGSDLILFISICCLITAVFLCKKYKAQIAFNSSANSHPTTENQVL